MDYNPSTMTGNAGSGDDTSLTEQAKQQTQEIARQGKEMAGRAASQAASQIQSGLASQKDRAADSLGSVAQVLRSTAGQLEGPEQQWVGQYAHTAAEWVDNMSGYLRERQLDDLIQDTEEFARRQPAVFLGGAFLLGFMAARFVKSSAGEATMSRSSSSSRYREIRSHHPPSVLRPTGEEPRIRTEPGTVTAGHELPTAYDQAMSRPTMMGASASATTPSSTSATYSNDSQERIARFVADTDDTDDAEVAYPQGSGARSSDV